MSVERAPEIVLTITDSAWPHSAGMMPGAGRCESFSTEREIVSGGLPSQIRARTGFSIGSGSATVSQPDGRPLVPYGSDDRRVTVGKPASISAHFEDGRIEPLGTWRIADVSGGLTQAAISVPLSEAQYGSPFAIMPTPVGQFDPAWMVDILARQIGKYSTPRPTESCVLSIPGTGGLHSERGTFTYTGGTFEPANIAGQAGITGSTFTTETVGDETFITLSTTGLTLDICGATTTVSPGLLSSGAASTTFTPGESVDPLRVQLRIDAAPWGIALSGRSGPDSVWSAPIPLGGASYENQAIHHVSGGFRGLQISRLPDPELWAAPTAFIPRLDAICSAPILPPQLRAWAAIQEITEAFLAAAWINRDGQFHARSRHQLAGLGRRDKVIDIATDADSLNWSIAADDFADRLEATWQSLEPDEDTEEWPVTEKIRVRAGSHAVFFVDLATFVTQIHTFANINLAAGDESTWEANTQANGEGTEITEGMDFTISRDTGSTARITVMNHNNVDVWLVDFDGEPAVIVRGTGALMSEPQPQIERGLSIGEAVSPISIDFGPLVQSEAIAESLTSYLWDRCQTPRWTASSIRIRLDLALDLGAVVSIHHAPSGLSTDALVTRINLTGSNGEVAQLVDLAVLPPTVSAFDATWSTTDAGTFDTTLTGFTALDFDSTPLKWR